MAETDLRIKLYETHVDLYKFYLDMAIKLDVFYLAAVGVFLTIYFTKAGSTPMLMTFSVILSGLACAIFYYWTEMIAKYADEDKNLKELLTTKIGAEYKFLQRVLVVSFAFAGTVAGSLAIWTIAMLFKGAR